jgi:hypothetical protein
MSRDEPLHPSADRDPRPTAYALHAALAAPVPWPEAELRVRVDAFLAGLTRSLRERGCRLIGHIKGSLDAEAAGHLFFSVTSFEEGPRYKGGISGRPGRLSLALNVIVYGVGMEEIEPLVRDGLQRHLGELDPGGMAGRANS